MPGQCRLFLTVAIILIVQAACELEQIKSTFAPHEHGEAMTDYDRLHFPFSTREKMRENREAKRNSMNRVKEKNNKHPQSLKYKEGEKVCVVEGRFKQCSAIVMTVAARSTGTKADTGDDPAESPHHKMLVKLDCEMSDVKRYADSFTFVAYAAKGSKPATRWLTFGEVEEDVCPKDFDKGDEVCVTGGKFAGCQGSIKFVNPKGEKVKVELTNCEGADRKALQKKATKAAKKKKAAAEGGVDEDAKSRDGYESEKKEKVMTRMIALEDVAEGGCPDDPKVKDTVEVKEGKYTGCIGNVGKVNKAETKAQCKVSCETSDDPDLSRRYKNSKKLTRWFSMEDLEVLETPPAEPECIGESKQAAT